MEELPFTYFHVFQFSERDKTKAEKIKSKISTEIKKKRSKILRDLSTKKRISFYKDFLGKTKNVLFESQRIDYKYNGYTDNFIKVLLDEKDKLDFRNQIIPVKLIQIKGDFVLGKFISS